MVLSLLVELEFLLRILLSGICGCLIGYERDNRLKEAGIRTHLIVALAASMMMVVSKYGFADVLSLEGVALDPSRIAAQIVSGVGFLGAGMIFVRGNTVNGLTTAAGIWATAGIGMAIGSGLYLVGIISTAFILLIQTLLHKKYKWFRIPIAETLQLHIKTGALPVAQLKEELIKWNLDIINLKAENLDNGYTEIKLIFKLPRQHHIMDLVAELNENPQIKVIER